MKKAPTSWQLPAGVYPGLWDYFHDEEMAKGYDAYLADSSLFKADLHFVARHCVRPGRMIDLGCGTGRLVISFAQRGYSVLGVDLSEAMLKVAQDKANQAGVKAQWMKANLVELDSLQDHSFDYAACLFSTLGMIRGTYERQRVVNHARRILKPGGKFILHVHNLWFNVWDPQGRRWLMRDLVRPMVGSEETGDRPMPPHHGLGEMSLHHFSRREATRLLRIAGFRVVEVCPVSLRPNGGLPYPAWFGWLRAYGYLIAAAS
jgi:ubiquinone/menaquinone biosynthesis C-methylase UbiE